jgi:hypothetical protein
MNKFFPIIRFSSLLFLTLRFFVSTPVIASHYTDTTKRIAGLPNVFNEPHGDLIESKLRQEAVLKFPLFQLPQSKNEWNSYRAELKNEIIKKTGALIHQNLPLNLKETGSLKMEGYTIKNIAFQTQPEVYATANLYVPNGADNDREKFPAVIVMMGHSSNGRLYDKYQAVGITLALNGYVSLCIDPWGSGERTTIHGVFEDHGDENNLGIALMDIGKPLMGMLITDNIRGVDLLCSLPYVDAQNIGATGSSGGGNQTMWLTAMDERIKAAVPVVSAGTFEAYIMGSPCICEVLTDGLTFTEESSVLALIAPRAIKMCNHFKDDLQAFNPREMLRSYRNAKPVFEMLGAGNKIAYQTFDLTHGYWPEDRQAMLGWFNLHLKGIGDGAAAKEIPFNIVPAEQLMVYAKGKRDPGVATTETYCKQEGKELRTTFLNTKSFNAEAKRNELRNILKVNEESILRNVHEYSEINGWSRFALETSDAKLIPVLLRSPSANSKEFVIISSSEGKENISLNIIDRLITSGSGIAVVDLSGTGETSSEALHSYDSVGRLRTLAKSYLWLGKTIMGEWVKELDVIAKFIHSKYKTIKISLDGSKEAGLAGLYLAALEGNMENVILRKAPVSYLFDNRDSIEFFSSGIHLPGFLNWGDVSLAAALSGKYITFINPLTISGQPIKGEKLQAYKKEFEQIRKALGKPGKTIFN